MEEGISLIPDARMMHSRIGLDRWTESDTIAVNGMPVEDILFPKDIERGPERYLWGQVNRIFPLKVALFVLANMVREKREKRVNLHEFGTRVSQIAQRVRAMLVQRTRKLTGGKESLWAGLPKRASEKSVGRFTSHFIGYIRSDGVVEGALAKLKFVNITRGSGKDNLISLTEPGLEFSRMRNPILDERVFTEGSLSNEEKEYYLRHISKYVPYEKQAFIDVLTLISEGSTSPSALNDGLKRMWAVDWSLEHVNTQRIGIVSRLTELGLVEKTKKGLEVEYNITERGKQFLHEEKK
jgi:hypothetical protein